MLKMKISTNVWGAQHPKAGKNIQQLGMQKVLRRPKPKVTKFSLKQVSKQTVLKAIKKMKNKKSASVDGIPQDILVLGASSVSQPLTNLINKSIETGLFCLH